MTTRPEKHLSTTALARFMEKESKELFVLLAGGGWILKVDDHWRLTEKGKFEGGIYVNHPKYGEYIAWPESVHQHPLFALLPEAPLTATNLSHKLSVPARLINLLLAERGWIKKNIRGWLLTAEGKLLGGQQQENKQSGIPYVTWPESFLDNKLLLVSVAQINAVESVADFPTLDGREAHNRAERMIANWLYLAGVVYAKNYTISRDIKHEQESCIAQFYVPQISLCIDFWPARGQADELAEQLAKQALYSKYQIPNIELREEDLPQLDEILARRFMGYGIAIY